MHRREAPGSAEADGPPELPRAIEEGGLQPHSEGVGPTFHRSYRVRIRNARMTPEELMRRLQADPNEVAPTRFARFLKTGGERGGMTVGDEYLIRMPGPWDGPVRVIAADATSFRLTTLSGHLEAGQIEFRASQGELLEFEIESWARSGDRVSNLAYSRLHVAKEVQLHMWVSFLERVVASPAGAARAGSRWRRGRRRAPVGGPLAQGDADARARARRAAGDRLQLRPP